MPRYLAEVLGEHRPHALQHEVTPLVRPAAAAICQALGELRDLPRGFGGDSDVAADEHRLVAREEEQGVVALRELN